MHLKHLILRAPEGATAPAAPTSAEPGSDDLVASLMADMNPTPAAPPAEPTPTAQPAAPAAKPASDKPTTPPAGETPKEKPATPAAKPAAPAQPAKPIDIDDPKVPAAELRKHLKQLQADLQQTKTEKETTISGLQSKLKQLESRKFWSEDDEKKHGEMTQRLNALEADLYARDFTKSPEYQKQFVTKINEQAKDALDMVKTLQTLDDSGDERQGNWDDITRLMGAANNAERRRMAKELFGENFQDALDAVMPMVETQKQAEAAVKSKSENYHSEMKQREQQSQQIQQFITERQGDIAEKFPNIFKPEETDTESQGLLNKGFSFVDESTQKQDMDVNERAARIAMIRSWAGAFPRLVNDLTKKDARIAELEGQISKLRGSDPGDGGDTGGGGSFATSDDGGSDDLAREIEALERK